MFKSNALFHNPNNNKQSNVLHQGASQHNIQTETHISVDNNEAQTHLALGVSKVSNTYRVRHNTDTCDYIELYRIISFLKLLSASVS